MEWIDARQHARLAKAAGLEPGMKAGQRIPLRSVRIVRDAPIALHRFSDYFRGFEGSEAVEKLFGTEAGAVIGRLKVEFFSARFGFIGVNDEDGHIIAGARHVRESPPRNVYLDLIFALHQVKRFSEGRPPLNTRWISPDNPAAIEAYKGTVDEARRIGMADSQISAYLDNGWITPAQHRKLVRTVGLRA